MRKGKYWYSATILAKNTDGWMYVELRADSREEALEILKKLTNRNTDIVLHSHKL